jgi:Fe-S cluster biogenesis protein NfuA
MTIAKSIIQVFSRQKKSEPTQQSVEPEISNDHETPKRVVIDAPLIQDARVSVGNQAILIKAMPSTDNTECRLMVNRPLFADKAWYFSSRDTTQGSALAEAVFAVDERIESLLVHDTILTLICRDHGIPDWRLLAEKAGAALRAHLESGVPSLSDEVLAMLPDDDTLSRKVQAVIDEEINPGVASHGGVIRIVKIKGNAVTISMGGGCQGCSSAAMTLKGGIEQAFRNHVPELGAILDATDHAAGSNPYFN